jgi:dihydrodipicolinate synthase/N-acetylneuraminate lyase
MTSLAGIIPVVVVPFDEYGAVDERGLRNVVRFELDGGVHAIGVNGFASEAYKLTDAERLRVARAVADEVGGRVPLVIGIAPGSVEAALALADELTDLQPATLMTLPPPTFGPGGEALIEFYVEFGRRSPLPVMVQQAPHIHAYSASLLQAPGLAAIAESAPTITAFKIEGRGAPARISELAPLVGGRGITLFGGGGGITFLDELRAGASGLIPGVGFNERFLAAWSAWNDGDAGRAEELLAEVQPLVNAVSGAGHEFSIHARKHLLVRAGLISTPFVRRPTVAVDDGPINAVFRAAEPLDLRLFSRASPGSPPSQAAAR